MKKIFYLIAVGLVFLSACEEELPTGLNLLPERSIFDTTYITNVLPSPQPTNVLIEDFTGVKCPNCPRAQGVAKTLLQSNQGRVFVMAIHPGKGLLEFYVKPFKTPGDDYDSKNDFRTDEGADILTFLGGSGQLPIGAINRTLFSSESKILIDDPKWSGKTAEKLATNSIVNIDTFSSKGVYFVEANKIRVNVKLTYLSSTNDSQYVSIALIEDHLLDFQESGATVIENYEHNHILRRMITPATGTKLKAPISAGRVFETTYDYELTPTETWNKANLKLLVFVHNFNNKEILQVKEYEIH